MASTLCLPRALRLLALAAALCPAFRLGAQPLAFRRYEGRDGLPQSQVRVMKEDRRGFLWVGTYGGVARLGASGFKSFGMAEGLSLGLVRDLMEDERGAMWVAQSDAGLARIDGSLVQRFGAKEGFPENDCYSLALDPSGALLVGHAKGIHRFDGRAFSPLDLGAWSALPVLSMVRVGPDLWLSTRGGRVARWDGHRLEEFPLPVALPAPDVSRLRLDRTGALWALTRPTLYRLEGSKWVAFAPPGFPKAPKLLDFDFDTEGNLQLSMGEGGLWIQGPDGVHQWLTTKDGLPQELIYSGYRDRQGILWVGSDGQGLYGQVIPGLQSLRGEAPLELGAVLSLREVEGQGLYLGSTRGLFLWQPEKGITAHWGVKDGLPASDVWCICPDGAGGLWLGTFRGLVRLRNGRVQPGPLFFDTRIYKVVRWRDATFVGAESGLAEVDGQGRVARHWNMPTEASSNDAYSLLPDDGGLLVGSSKGLFRFDGSEIRRVYPDVPFADIQIISLYRSGGDLWVGTIQGLYLLRGGVWKRYSVEEGLPDAQIYFVGDGGHGRIAVGHGKGVSLFEPDGTFRTLNQNLGLISDETNKDAVLLDSRGRLWFGMVYGACSLDTSLPLRLPEAPAPRVLEAIWAKGRASLPTALELPPRAEFVEFDFELGLPVWDRPPVYEVWLDGLSSQWQRVSEGHRARFARLDAGTYTFRVRASLDGQHWVEGRPVALKVRPTWYEHPLGRAALVLLAAGLVAAVIHWRTLQLRKAARVLEVKVEDRTRSLDQRNRELEEAHAQVKDLLKAKVAFTRMVVHDLRSPLTTLALLLDSMAMDAEDRGQAPPEGLAVMRQETGRLEDMLRRLLDQARIEAVDQSLHMAAYAPARILDGMEAALRLKAQNAGIAFTWEAEDVEGTVVADALAVQQIVLNLFSNALKVTEPGGRVGLRSSRDGENWALEIWDTGRGMAPSQVDHLFRPFTQAEIGDVEQGWGLGLSIVKALVDAHGAELKVDSTLGKGTRFQIVFPILA